MGKLAKDLERMRPACSSNLLQAILKQNPDANVRAKACMALATLQKDAAGYGTNANATAAAEKLYERLVSEFGQLPGERGYTFGELAQVELSELRRLSIGKIAPEIDGQDLYGRPMSLSAYRGKVVTLLFWYPDPIDVGELHNFRRLVEQMQGRPFALLGIYVDDDIEKGKALAEEHQMNWPSFRESRQRLISDAYRARSNPTIYVLDRQGVIRYRGFRFCGQVAVAADKLLRQ
jgi:peroxiredoxin